MANKDTPENIGTLTCITSPLWWIVVAVLLSMGGAVLLWSLFGEIFVTVSGLGYVAPAQGRITVVPARATGRVVKMYVNQGDNVRANDLIAQIAQPQLKSQVDAARSMMNALHNQRERQAKQSQEYLSKRGSVVQGQVAAQQEKLKSLQENSAFRAQVLLDMEDEMKQGFTTRTQVEQARNDKITTDLNLRDTSSQIQTLRTQLEEDRASAQRQLFTLDQDILKAQQQAEELESSLALSQNIVAPINGRVASLATFEGKVVVANDSVVIMEPEASGVMAVAYFQIADGKKIQTGAKVRIKIGSIDSDVYGTAVGTVSSVADLPSTTESLRNGIENKTMVAQLEKAGAPLAAFIRFEPVPGKPGFIMMSSGRPSPVAISVGTTLTAQVIVQKSMPISYVIRLFN